jgi:hypothetical protein
MPPENIWFSFPHLNVFANGESGDTIAAGRRQARA